MSICHPLVAEFRGLRRGARRPAKCVAAAIAVDRSVIHNWEQNRNAPTLDRFDRALRYLGYKLVIQPITKQK
jgi:DNA-binding transcriptional regulator YiaG